MCDVRANKASIYLKRKMKNEGLTKNEENIFFMLCARDNSGSHDDFRANPSNIHRKIRDRR